MRCRFSVIDTDPAFMPAPIVCPNCREELDIPAEYRGRPVRCGNCQTVFAPTPDAGPPVVRPRPSAPRPAARPPDDDRPPRRSNAAVWLMLLFTFFAAGGCCGGFTLLFFAQVNPTLTPHASAEGKFRAEFPGENPTGSPLAPPPGEKPAGDPGWVVMADRPLTREHYVVKRYRLKGEWRKLPPEEALAKLAEGELKALDAGTAGPQEQATHAGFPARDVRAEKGDGLVRQTTILRCVLLPDGRVYAVAVQGPNVEPELWWVRQFFQSVEFTDPPPVPKEKE